MKTIAAGLHIKSAQRRRGKPHASVEATTSDPNHDVRIVAAGFVHGPNDTLGADLAIKVVPK
jgi:hypothetical protein